MWDRKNDDWEEDLLYGCIRKYQPEAMIINNTGLNALGMLGHIELDSVTFERGKPQPINQKGAQKYVASEMCEIFGDHWGYAAEDLNYKSPALMIEELAECRKYGANMLINVGPMGDGSLRQMDNATLGVIGQWVNYFDEAIRRPRPTGIKIENKAKDFILRDGKNYYLFCFNLHIEHNENVTAWHENENSLNHFEFDEEIESVTWLDNGADVTFVKDKNKMSIFTEPFVYGRSLVVRVAKIICK